MQPNVARVSESIEIEKPAQVIYDDLIQFPNWENWSVWDQMDPNMVNEYFETMGEIGSYNSWVSEDPMVGAGRQELVELREGEYLKLKMDFEAWPGTKYAAFTLDENNGITTVTWTYEGSKTPFFLNFMNSSIETMLSKSYKDGLSNMKAYIEAMETSVPNPYNLIITEVKPRNIISIKDSCSPAEVSSKLGELYGELSVFMTMNEELSGAGMPIALYHFYSEEKGVLEATLPVNGTVKPEGRINMTATPSGKVLKGIHLGSYESSESMHMGIEEYMKASNLDYAGPCWEVYANDPTTVEESEIETHIFYPIK